jgi:o-succinylbenzoate synthase
MKVVRGQLIPIRLPLARPIRSARGIVAARECTLLRLETDVGLVGCGEASPYPGFGNETPASARAALERAVRDSIGQDVDVALAGRASDSLAARAALETALLELQSKAQGVSLCERLSAGSAHSVRKIQCNVLVAGEDPVEVARQAASAKARGFETFKLKVGALALERDRLRAAALRDVVGPDAKIRLDANQAYDESEAADAIAAFAPFAIEYLEQPVAASDIDAMAALRRKSPIPLAADEAAIGLEDVRRVIVREAADVIIIKPGAAGGPRAALGIAQEARHAGLDLVVTSIIDSAVGVATALHVAAAIANEGALRACGLATAGLFEFDVASLGAPMGGSLQVPRGVGLGIEANPSLLAQCQDAPMIEIDR